MLRMLHASQLLLQAVKVVTRNVSRILKVDGRESTHDYSVVERDLWTINERKQC